MEGFLDWKEKKFLIEVGFRGILELLRKETEAKGIIIKRNECWESARLTFF